MWRISSALTNKCCYRNQKISYCDSVRVTICDIYNDGKKRNSAYIGSDTRIIYRSQASRMVYFLQISAEMWHFEESGQVVFHKMIDSFLPEVFKRWHDHGAHHVVTIILFTSVDVSNGEAKLGHGEVATKTKDYFRVVVDQVHISKWSEIMETLRYEFSRFDRDVLLQEDGKIQGRILPAVKGNLLQVISMATSLASSRFIDRDLRRTAVQTLIVTPGTGIFDVDYDLMYQTSLQLLSVEIGIDLVCLSRDPLHVTPLFRYKDKSGVVKHCVPSWLDISFWSTSASYTKQWIPRCKIYEIQMMGVMENEVSAISIDYLPQGFSTSKYADDLMTDYDEAIFKSKDSTLTQRAIDESVSEASNFPTPPVLIPAAPVPTRAITTTSFNDPIEFKPESPKPVEEHDTKPKSALTSLLSHGVTPQSPSANSTLGRISDPSRLFWSFGRKSTSSMRSTASREDNAISAGDQLTNLFTSHLETSTQPAQKEDLKEPLHHSSAVPITHTNRWTKTGPSQYPNMSSSPARLSHSLGKRPSFGQRISDSSVKPAPRVREKKEVEERHSMWMTIANPSNVPENKFANISNYGRWQFVYPKKIKRRAVKWRSLKSPAALPLVTPIFPSLNQFKNNYRFNVYSVTLYHEHSEYSTIPELLHEMVAIRLATGFQIVAKDRVKGVEAVQRQGDPSCVVEIIPPDAANCRIFMSNGSHIHRLVVDMGSGIQVQTYTNADLQFLNFDQNYRPFVKTRYDDKYRQTSIDFYKNTVRTFNWNQIDQSLTGYQDYILGDPRMYRVRLVLVPVDVPVSAFRKPFNDGPDKLNSEEIRIEGLKRLLTLIHRGRFYSGEERNIKTTAKQLNTSVPDVKYYTGDLGSFLLQMKQNHDSDMFSGPTNKRNTLFVQPTERFTKRISIAHLASEMQGEKGVKFVDRPWHWKMHYQCFMGSEFVTWLLNNFSDIETPEEAVEYGNHLMSQKLIHHVENRHSFLNGHYFYQMYPNHVIIPDIQERQAWFAKRPSTGDSSLSRKSRSQSSTSLVGTAKLFENLMPVSPAMKPQATPSPPLASVGEMAPPPTVLLSRSIPYNVDLAKRSPRPEILTFHFDRVHNPDNCFQMRLEWLNTTPKLIDDAIINMGRVTEQYGLRLVQVPIQEISQLPKLNPFVSLFKTRFALDPGTPEARQERSAVAAAAAQQANPDKDDMQSLSSAQTNECNDPLDDDPLYFHKYALKEIGYYLDVELISERARQALDIQFSWGKPFYEHSQYLHKSGLALVQVLADGQFVWMTNFLTASKIGVHSPQRDAAQGVYQSSPTMAGLGGTPGSSPTMAAAAATGASSEYLLDELKALCADPGRLSELYAKAMEAWLSKGKSDLDKMYTAVN